jgi:RNA polymerase sigma-70 factor (ECF subfamily)
MEQSDNELISRAQNGEVAAFEQLVRRYDRMVLGIANRFAHNAEDAQDIYQDVFLKVYRGIGGFQFKSQFSTWLYRVVTNVCLSHQKKSRRAQRMSSLEEMTENGRVIPIAAAAADRQSPDRLYRDVEIADRVKSAVAELPDQQRLVFVLKHFEQLKISEIAATMSCAEGTVKKYLFLATRKLRAQLRPATG